MDGSRSAVPKRAATGAVIFRDEAGQFMVHRREKITHGTGMGARHRRTLEPGSDDGSGPASSVPVGRVARFLATLNRSHPPVNMKKHSTTIPSVTVDNRGLSGTPDEVVETVHAQLEYLKYVPRSGRQARQDTLDGNTAASALEVPAGEGIDISALLLPCLVLDFRKENLHAEGKTCAVGGRAARIACALLHLQDEDDGTYRVNLLTKTGNLGRLLLENEFYLPGDKRRARHLNLELVDVREGQPRCALIDPFAANQIDAKEIVPGEELSDAGLDCIHVKRAVEEAGVVCLTSVKTPHFKSLFDGLWSRLDFGTQCLFIDATRSARADLRSLLQVLITRKPGSSITLFLPFENEVEKSLLAVARKVLGGTWSIQKLARKLNVEIIAYGTERGVCHVPSDGGNPTRVPCGADFALEDIPERLKAGILLAHGLAAAVWKMRADAERRNDPAMVQLHEDLWRFWAGNKWEKILKYAVALATAKPNKESFCCLASILAPNVGDSAHAPSCAVLEPIRDVTQRAASHPWREFKYDAARLLDLARLAGLRRLRKGKCTQLALCDPVREGCPTCTSRQCASNGSPTAAILIDLDSTLMNSTRERARALAPALLKLPLQAQQSDFYRRHPPHPGRRDHRETAHTGSDPQRPHESEIEYFENRIYSLHPLFTTMGKGDFRQVWNHAGWYAAYLVFRGNDDLAERVAVGWQSLETSSRHGDAIRKKRWWRDFEHSYDEVLRRYAESIRAAQAEFRNRPLSPLKETRDFLRSLRDTQACRLYVVSEGDPATQWLKICLAGLSDFFTQDQVLTTGDAAQPVKELTALLDERNRLDRDLESIDAKRLSQEQELVSLAGMKAMVLRRLNGEALSAINTVRDLIEEQERRIPDDYYDKARNSVDRLKTEIRATEFSELVLKRVQEKRVLSFYAAVVRAILREPDFPREALRSFDQLLGKKPIISKLKFAMIGDRQKNDIAPPSELLGDHGILTIRLLCGQYAIDEPPADTDTPQPQFIVGTLAQAKAILLSKIPWQTVKCMGDPPLFNWAVDLVNPDAWPRKTGDKIDDAVIGLNYILHGIRYSDDSTATRKICSGVLAEHLVRYPKDISKVIEACVRLPQRRIWPDAGPIARCLVLSSLVEAGLRSPTLPAHDAKSVRDQLQLDKEHLDNWPSSERLSAVLSKVQRALVLLEA